jgi:phage terminase large subunit GpA-like protein
MNTARQLIQEETRRLRNPPKITPAQWAEDYRRMSAGESPYVGRFSFRIAPYFRWFLERWMQPDVKKGVCRKSAQVGWTQSVICNFLGYDIHVERSTCIVMFPKDGAARNFDREKFGPLVEGTPVLAPLMPVKSRVKDVTALFKAFPGGFIKFVGSNSISDVKSSSAKRLIVEEPDDCNLNLRGQGDAIKLLEERGKQYRDLKMLIGGTPSIEGVSAIDAEILQSDENYWEVPCPDCGQFQRLEWEQVKHTESDALNHPVFGQVATDSARYLCANCGSLWDDAQKNRAVQRGRAVASRPFAGILGLSLNELYSQAYNSRLQILLERYLTAKHGEARGDIGDLITFWNAALGRSWRYQSDIPKADQLAERGEDYEEGTVPHPALMLTSGVDVQHDRVHVHVWAWGPGEEAWLVTRIVIWGNTLVPEQGAWPDLDKLLARGWKHAAGVSLYISATSIDSGDGQTAEAVYAFVRKRKHRRYMATKGVRTEGREIFSQPKPSIDVNARQKAAKFGLKPYLVGTERAKDLLLGADGGGRIKLTGSGPGRLHWFRTVSPEFFEQLTAEIKAPAKNSKKLVWQEKAGARNEDLDCAILALHASRHPRVKVHLAGEADWAALRAQLLQGKLELAGGAAAAPPVADSTEPSQEDSGPETAVVETSAPPGAPGRVTIRPPRRGGFVKNW